MLTALLAILPCLSPLPQVVISEFQAVNDAIIEDEDGDRSDWIELNNAGTSSVDLGGWALSDDPQLLARWEFPAGTVLWPGQFLVVFASDKNRAVAGAELHTDFKLSGGGETLALLRPDGTTAQDFGTGFPDQFADISYGLELRVGQGLLEGYFTAPTPGQANGEIGPAVVDVDHTPQTPMPGEDLWVTAEIAAHTPAASVDLIVRRMYDPEFTLSMRDDGQGGDQSAGDGIWTARIPAGTALPGEMLRWAVETEDGIGGANRLPGFPLPVDSREYFGTIVQDPTIQSGVEVYHWFLESPGGALGSNGTRCSLWYADQFYDNIFARRRGGSSANWQKRSFKIDFNRGDHFRYQEDRGRVSEINLNTTWSDKSYLRRVLGWEAFSAAGQPGSESFLVHLRRNNEFYQLTTFVEQPDEDLLDRFGWDEDTVGPLYKMYNVLDRSSNGVEKKTRREENNSDLKDLVNGLKLSGTAQRDYIFDNVDLPAVMNYIAVTNLIHNNDHIAKNYYVYRDVQTDDEWWFIPWDLDLTHGRNYTLGGGVLNDTIWADRNRYSHPLFGDRNKPKNDGPWNRLIDAVFQHSESRELYLRRFRTIMDELLQAPGTPRAELWYETRMDQLAAEIAPDVAADVLRWGIPNYGDRNQDYLQALQIFETDYLQARRVFLYETLGPLGTQELPGPEPDAPQVGFASWVSDPVSGNQAEEFLEITNLETTAIDLSGYELEGDVEFRFEPGTVIGAGRSLYVSPDLRAFRARATSPTGGEAHLVVGPFRGDLPNTPELRLRNRGGQLIAHTDAPILVAHRFQAGVEASLSMLGATPGGQVSAGYSLTGPGPTNSPFGVLSLSAPLYSLPTISANAFGGGVWRAQLPPASSGMSVWLQGYDHGTSRLTPGLALAID